MSRSHPSTQANESGKRSNELQTTYNLLRFLREREGGEGGGTSFYSLPYEVKYIYIYIYIYKEEGGEAWCFHFKREIGQFCEYAVCFFS